MRARSFVPLIALLAPISWLAQGCGDSPSEPLAPPSEESGTSIDRDAQAPAADTGSNEDSAIGKPDGDVDSSTPIGIQRTRFALIGDYGVDDAAESAVAQLVIAEDPEFVLTLGDNNYPLGLASTIDENIGKYYHSFIAPYKGTYGQGASVNRFWPCLGNHDWGSDTMQPYADYFELPGNERYWDLVRGNVHFFCIDSDPHEPDGRTPASTQGQWLTSKMAASQSPFKFVLMHHPPYSSGAHGSTTTMQWPYASYGADGVWAGHDHSYERLEVDNIPYLVQGTGGAGLYSVNTSLPQSVFDYNASHGTTIVRADEHHVVFESITTSRELIDVFAVSSRNDGSVTRRSLVKAGATWSYKDDGVAPTGIWTDAVYDASSWQTGPAMLGYGQVGVATTVSYGGNASQKHITTYFRTTFNVAKVDDVAWLSLLLKKDDGAIIYLNGKEAFRSNMPPGAITPSTEARYRVGYMAEGAWEPIALDASMLAVGTNAIAVEVHQSNAASSDAMFDLSLDAVLR